MGLMVHSLNEIPEDSNRSYYIYLLDYGWKEPLSEVINRNWDKIADMASKNNAVFIKGTIGSHVDNEVLSWHHINGENGETVLPSLLITMDNPHNFRRMLEFETRKTEEKMVLIPLKQVCKSNEDVIALIAKIFEDIKNKKTISDFSVKKIMKKGVGARLRDSVILQPNINGIGFDLKQFFANS